MQPWSSKSLKTKKLEISYNLIQFYLFPHVINLVQINTTPINLRLKAANKSYLNGSISIESLAALYQSVDFDSKQLNNPNDKCSKQNIMINKNSTCDTKFGDNHCHNMSRPWPLTILIQISHREVDHYD